MSIVHINNQQPTPYHDLNRVLHELVTAVGGILGEDFVGAYLQGSFAVGDFDLHSDVDFLVVMRQELSLPQVEALRGVHGRVYAMNSRWAKHLEGSYFPAETLRAAPRAGEALWYIDNGSRVLERSDHCNTLVVRSVLREQGVTLAGPAPETLLDQVPREALRREIYTTMQERGQEILQAPDRVNNRFYQAYTVLSYCRMLHDLHRGQIGSKLAGAEWVIYQGLAREWDGLIERSWARRANPANWIGLPADEDDFAATLAFVRYMMGLGQEFYGTTDYTDGHRL